MNDITEKKGSVPATAAMSPDAAGGDDSDSALFLALQNPTLSKAASVLLRSMQETGTISGEDAALMSAFLASCDMSCEIPPGPGGSAGNKRARDTGSGFRYSVGCGGDLQFCPALEPGRYRMHCPVAKTDNYLFVRREATEEDEPCQVKLAVSDMVVRPGDQLKTFYAAHGKLHFDIYPDTGSFLVLWVQKDLDEHTLKYLPAEERPEFISAKQIIEFPTFQVLFQKDVESMLLVALQKMKQKSND